jgi:hypothetical protein
MILRRVCFGEPKPGEQQFADILAKLDGSASYCNRIGTLQHDRVTDLAYSVPLLGLNLIHPTPLLFVSAAPAANDPDGVFALHHMPLYAEGASSLDPVTAQCANLCRGIYAYPGDTPIQWDHRADTAGVAWGIKFDGDRAYVVFRGSDDLLDWLRDLTALDPDFLLQRIVHHDTFGPMWGGFLIGMAETWAAIKPLVASIPEIVFTGHSLGAARADIASGYALQYFRLGSSG